MEMFNDLCFKSRFTSIDGETIAYHLTCYANAITHPCLKARCRQVTPNAIADIVLVLGDIDLGSSFLQTISRCQSVQDKKWSFQSCIEIVQRPKS